MEPSYAHKTVEDYAAASVAQWSRENQYRNSVCVDRDSALADGQHGTPFGVHRDSDILERSNWNVISADLEKRFPDDVAIERFSHWAVGWMDHLVVRMLTNDGTPTDAARAVFEWKKKLENYPIADENHFMEAENADEIETWENCYRRDLARILEKRDDTRAIMEALEDRTDLSVDEAMDALFYGDAFEAEWQHDSGGASIYHFEQKVAELTPEDLESAIARALETKQAKAGS